MALFSKTKPLVGLDIGSSSLKAVELIKIKKNFQLSGFAYEPISPDAVVDGAIMDFLPIAETIKTSFVGAKFKAKGVATGVSGHSVIVKRVVIPAMTWQGQNAVESNRDGWPDSLDTGSAVPLTRGFLHGRPPASVATETVHSD